VAQFPTTGLRDNDTEKGVILIRRGPGHRHFPQRRAHAPDGKPVKPAFIGSPDWRTTSPVDFGFHPLLIAGIAAFTISCIPEAERVASLAATPERAALSLASQTLASANPAFERKYILQDGPATDAGGGFDVKLKYWAPSESGLRRFTCHTVGPTARCVPVAPAASVTGSIPMIGTSPGRPSAPQPLYVGPRGGVYHYSPSGKKVYERHRRLTSGAQNVRPISADSLSVRAIGAGTSRFRP
jgi:hypothetical protein